MLCSEWLWGTPDQLTLSLCLSFLQKAPVPSPPTKEFLSFPSPSSSFDAHKSHRWDRPPSCLFLSSSEASVLEQKLQKKGTENPDLGLCFKKLATAAQKTSISTWTSLPCPVICFGIFAVHSRCPPRVAIWEFMAPDQPTTLSLRPSLSLSRPHSPFPPLRPFSGLSLDFYDFRRSLLPSPQWISDQDWMNEMSWKISSASHVKVNKK